MTYYERIIEETTSPDIKKMSLYDMALFYVREFYGFCNDCDEPDCTKCIYLNKEIARLERDENDD